MTFKLLIAMPGKEENQARYMGALDRLGLLQHCAFTCQVNSHEPVTEHIAPGVGERIYNRIETDLAREAKVVGDHESFFVNHEPKYDGRVGWQWLRLRYGYQDADIEVLREMGKAIGKHPLPGTMYNMPVQRPDMFGDEWREIDDQRLAAASLISEHWGWVWHGLYPTGLAKDRRITWFDLETHKERVIEGYNRLKVLGKPIVPAIWPRFAWDNANWYGLYFKLMGAIEFDRMVVWTDLREAFMTGVYITELEEVAPLLHELIERKSQGGVE